MADHDLPLDPTWRAVLRDLGVRPETVLRRARLPMDLWARGGAVVSTAEYLRFWEAWRAEVDAPLFPLQVAESATHFAPVFAALCSPNLRVGLERLARYKRLVAPMKLELVDEADALTVTFAWLDARRPAPASLVAMELALVVHLARTGTREQVRLRRATAPRRPEPAFDYRRYFGVNITAAPRVSLTFARADAEIPFLTADESLWETLEPGLRRRLAQLDAMASTSERVRAALLESLPRGRSTIDAIARRLATSKRTLQRRLRREGTSFLALLNGTRLELAKHYLSQTALSCTEISFLLGFEDPNSFFRAFHDWTGESPETMRRALA